ncbi:MAG TPA: DsbA family protein [Verrucomicrobiae bacterium]|jgi:predicted DsbA family dithiol-disulfide isomerase|nr:DsbA family protein [Verrucomicrobiae bacterium]
MKIIIYVEVTSSWCYWAEPAWAELKKRYAGRAEFDWKIALMPFSAHPVSREQRAWFYQRSGAIMRSPFALNADWADPDLRQHVVPNYIAQAAREFTGSDERVRLALGQAALREGRHVWQWDVAAQVAAEAAGLDRAALLTRARTAAIEAQVNATTAEFHALQVTQRPAFLLENEIGDRAVFSGIVKAEPIAATIDAMMADATAYACHTAHFGGPPPA